ncbi:DUF2829 domain-containing protein [Draconibacterium sp.]|uniref:DUF2829 domain-containing protein n=1 Tax=Draconibacterium sp. TaxID=1965318 RepID=UPI003569B620
MNKKNQIIKKAECDCDIPHSPGPLYGGLPQFIGVKIIGAVAMDMVSFKQEKGEPYEGENAPGYKVVYEDGYTSWSPKHVFEKAYKPVREHEPGLAIMLLNVNTRNWRYAFNGEDNGENGMSFGSALEALKNGHKVQRSGWNGKGMWLIYVDGKTGVLPKGANSLLPWIGMKTADDKFVPWLASQTDMLADDWIILGVTVHPKVHGYTDTSNFTDWSKLKENITFGDLLEFCKPLSEEQLKEPVRILREDSTIHNLGTEILDENYVYDVENPENGCFRESDIDDIKESSSHVVETKIVYKKGTPILWEDF